MSDKDTKKTFTSEERKILAKLDAMPEEEIDTSDMPEIPDEKWEQARRANFYRPLKQPVTIRLDSDVVAWFKDRAGGKGYQTEINRVLRRHVAAMEGRGD
jgi:uncharacterized protein (DUF4415 family)